jgi:hypothetical protein
MRGLIGSVLRWMGRRFAGWPVWIGPLAGLVLGVGLALASVWLLAPVLPMRPVAGVFADVNGDGALDFIVDARVVFSPSPLSSGQ